MKSFDNRILPALKMWLRDMETCDTWVVFMSKIVSALGLLSNGHPLLFTAEESTSFSSSFSLELLLFKGNNLNHYRKPAVL